MIVAYFDNVTETKTKIKLTIIIKIWFKASTNGVKMFAPMYQ